jgi:hypothetical protein
MRKQLLQLALDPFPLRTIVCRAIQRLELFSYPRRLALMAVDRPHYGYCVYSAAALAKKLGYPKISVIEFGVAGGNGLVNLEYHAEQVSHAFGIEIEIYGFDTGEGLPEPVDYRDLPYHWKKGFFRMDVPKVRTRLKRAKLVLGDIRETSKSFFADYNPMPIGAVIHDFDFYSSTAVALGMFDANEKYYLPRVFCYFDDTIGTEVELYNDFTGERLAINEFNQTHTNKKLGVSYHLMSRKLTAPWFRQIWICHLFSHSRYNDFVSEEDQQLPCR